MRVLTHDALKRQAEHLHAERVLVTVSLHVSQIGVLEVALRLKRPDARIPHIQGIRLRRGEQVAAKIRHRIGVVPNAHGFILVLLRLKQRSCILWLAELLHLLPHDDGQLAANFYLQLWVTLVQRDDFRKSQDYPA